MAKREITAIEYRSTLDLSAILKKPGDTINVFLPVEYFTVDNKRISPSFVRGSRPFSIDSDLVAICCAIPILYPHERKDGTVLMIAPSHFHKYGSADDSKIISEEIRIDGVLIAATAVKYDGFLDEIGGTSPPDSPYGHSVALDIIDYAIISEFEPRPRIISDAMSCVYKAERCTVASPDDIVIDYEKDVLSGGVESVLCDFAILFGTDNCDFVLKRGSGGYISLLKGGTDEVVIDNVSVGSIVFGDSDVSIGDFSVSGVKHVIFRPLE